MTARLVGASPRLTSKPSLSELLMIIHVLMNSWEKDAYTSSCRTQGEAKRKGLVAPTTDNSKHPALMLHGTPTTSKPLWANTLRGGRPNHKRDECRQRDIPDWNDQGDSKAYKYMDVYNTTLGQGDKHPVLMRALSKAASKEALQVTSPTSIRSPTTPTRTASTTVGTEAMEVIHYPPTPYM